MNKQLLNQQQAVLEFLADMAASGGDKVYLDALIDVGDVNEYVEMTIRAALMNLVAHGVIKDAKAEVFNSPLIRKQTD